MKRLLVLAVCFLSFLTNLYATTVNVNCKNGPIRKIGTVLNYLNPRVPNTINVTGTCKENLLLSHFDDLSLIAAPGAAIVDGSGGQIDVIGIWDSRRVTVQGFKISGGMNGINCSNGSYCTLAGNTVEAAASFGIIVKHAQAFLSDDTVQDNANTGMDVEYADVLAFNVTLQRNLGGLYSQGMTLEGYDFNVLDNRGVGINAAMKSNVFLAGGNFSNNTADGIGIYGQSYAFVTGVTVTNNAGTALSLGDLSLVNGDGTFTASGSGVDIGCWGAYSVASLANPVYGSTNCPFGQAQSNAAQRAAPARK